MRASRTVKLFFQVRPRSRLRIWTRKTGSVIPSGVSPLIFATQAESGTVHPLLPGTCYFTI